MRIRKRSWLLSLIMTLGLALSMAQSADARSLSDQLPMTKEPSSAKFDISGNITSKGIGEDVTIQISGSGQMAKDKLQMDMTLAVPDLQPAPGSPNSFTISMITLDQKLYFKMTGLSTEGDDKWYVSNLSDTGSTGLMPGMGMGMTGLDPELADALTVTDMGKEAINGAPTTKYKVDLDLDKLNTLSGSTTDPSTLDNASIVMYMWVGDNDMYLHQMRLEMDIEIAEPSGGPSSQLLIDLTMTFKEFDQPVNIVAPANAEPLDLTSGGILSGIPGGSIVTVPIGTGMGMTTGMGMGMPRSGNSDHSLTIALAMVGLMLVGSGSVLRRRAVRVRVS